MPRLLTGGNWPVTERRFVPDAHGSEGYRELDQIISMVRVLERGPDVSLRLFLRGLPLPQSIDIPARDEAAFLSRLFRDPPIEDRELVMRLLQDFEDAIVGDDIEAKRMAWRRVMALYDAMSADLHALSGLPQGQRGAA